MQNKNFGKADLNSYLVAQNKRYLMDQESDPIKKSKHEKVYITAQRLCRKYDIIDEFFKNNQQYKSIISPIYTKKLSRKEILILVEEFFKNLNQIGG